MEIQLVSKKLEPNRNGYCPSIVVSMTFCFVVEIYVPIEWKSTRFPFGAKSDREVHVITIQILFNIYNLNK